MGLFSGGGGVYTRDLFSGFYGMYICIELWNIIKWVERLRMWMIGSIKFDGHTTFLIGHWPVTTGPYFGHWTLDHSYQGNSVAWCWSFSCYISNSKVKRSIARNLILNPSEWLMVIVSSRRSYFVEPLCQTHTFQPHNIYFAIAIVMVISFEWIVLLQTKSPKT